MTYWNPPPDPTQHHFQPYEPLSFSQPPRRRRRLLWSLMGGLVVAGAVAATVVLTTSGSSSRASATPLPTTIPSSPSTTAPHRVATRPAVRGTIEAEQGSTWTLKTARGATVTVTVTPQTAWGTPAAPATESQFVTGDKVVVMGHRAHGSVTATRVLTSRA